MLRQVRVHFSTVGHSPQLNQDAHAGYFHFDLAGNRTLMAPPQDIYPAIGPVSRIST